MAGEPSLLLTTIDLEAVGLPEIMRGLGGTVDPGHTDQGRVSRGRCHVWVYLGVEEWEDGIPADIVAKLGGVARSGLTLIPSRGPGGDRLVLDVARAFAARWPAVLWNEVETLDLAELRQRLTGAFAA